MSTFQGEILGTRRHEEAVAMSKDGCRVLEADVVVAIADGAYWFFDDPSPFRQEKILLEGPVGTRLVLEGRLADDDALAFRIEEMNGADVRQQLLYGFLGELPEEAREVEFLDGQVDDLLLDLRFVGMKRVFLTRHEFCPALPNDRLRVYRPTLRAC